jgi:hypothetical protein
MALTGDGASAAVVWDDTTMQASGFQIHIPDTDRYTVTFTAVTTDGQVYTKTYPANNEFDEVIPLSSPQAVVYVTTRKGTRGISFPWLQSIGMSSSNG